MTHGWAIEPLGEVQPVIHVFRGHMVTAVLGDAFCDTGVVITVSYQATSGKEAELLQGSEGRAANGPVVEDQGSSKELGVHIIPNLLEYSRPGMQCLRNWAIVVKALLRNIGGCG